MDTTDRDRDMTGGFLTAGVTRTGEGVRRTAGPWSPAVHAVLAHLASAGLHLAPRPLALDPAAATEVLSFVPGEVVNGATSPEWLWGEETLTGVARLMRAYHDATVDFTPPAGAVWQETAVYPGGGPVICHNDVAPWNTVFVDGRPVAFIDWDLAAPGPRKWDIAFALWHFVPLYGEQTDPWDRGVLAPRDERARAFCDAYGLPDEDRAGLVETILARQARVYEVFRAGAEAGDPAYSRLWEMGAGDGIARQIRYVTRHRDELERALT